MKVIEKSALHLQAWCEDFEGKCPPALVYLLEDKYSDEDLSRHSRFKEVERFRIRELEEACRQNNCELLLANMEKADMGNVEVDDGDSSDGCRRTKKKFHTMIETLRTSLELSRVCGYARLYNYKETFIP